MSLVIMRWEAHMIQGLLDLIEYVPNSLVLVEVGSYTGESTEIFAKSNKFSKIYSVDPYLSGYDQSDPASHSNMEEVEKAFIERMKPYSVIQIKKKSADAAADFENQSIDMVYIDGDHLTPSVKLDIQSWLPKIKKGGFISGHDYASTTGIFSAVNDLLGPPDKVFSDMSWIKEIKQEQS